MTVCGIPWNFWRPCSSLLNIGDLNGKTTSSWLRVCALHLDLERQFYGILYMPIPSNLPFLMGRTNYTPQVSLMHTGFYSGNRYLRSSSHVKADLSWFTKYKYAYNAASEFHSTMRPTTHISNTVRVQRKVRFALQLRAVLEKTIRQNHWLR